MRCTNLLLRAAERPRYRNSPMKTLSGTCISQGRSSSRLAPMPKWMRKLLTRFSLMETSSPVSVSSSLSARTWLRLGSVAAVTHGHPTRLQMAHRTLTTSRSRWYPCPLRMGLSGLLTSLVVITWSMKRRRLAKSAGTNDAQRSQTGHSKMSMSHVSRPGSVGDRPVAGSAREGSCVPNRFKHAMLAAVPATMPIRGAKSAAMLRNRSLMRTPWRNPANVVTTQYVASAHRHAR
mmetsp:Transcript_1218/g.3353  ORF Transcript_1218/g.3353 Transcript_1218/m.3353 type:complete len:234 (-) Transcript_1218:1200-1901(-)